MRKNRLIKASVALCCGSALIAAADYYLKIQGVASGEGSGVIYLDVQSSADLEGDGALDEGFVRLTCAGGQLRAASFRAEVKSPRDAASGQASGRRAHQPLVPVKEWVPAAPELELPKITPKIAKESHGRMASDPNGWTPIELSDADGLCPAAEDAARRATKPRSNVQNN